MRVLVRAFWHIRGRLAVERSDAAYRRYIALARAAEKFFNRRDRA